MLNVLYYHNEYKGLYVMKTLLPTELRQNHLLLSSIESIKNIYQ